jgi:hypothetical protein
MRVGSHEFPAGAFSIIHVHAQRERERERKGRRTQAQTRDASSFSADGNRSSGFSDRANQCKQLDIAGNISFLRAARRSTAKRAQTVTGRREKRKRVPVLGESLSCLRLRRASPARSHPARRLAVIYSVYFMREPAV